VATSAQVSVRLVSATNPMDGVIVARFNQAMQHDAAFLSTLSWSCTPASPSALAITLVEVLASVAYPEMALLRYTGGADEYALGVRGVLASSGNAVDLAFSSVALTIEHPGDVDPTIRLFDTIWGPLGMAQRRSLRRSMDQIVQNRAIAVAVGEQLKQRMASGDGTAGRDGRPGLART
jgi:hypothetical protein